MEGSLVSAESRNLRVNGLTGERIDLVKQREVETEAQAKIDAADAADARRRAVEQKRKQSEADAKAGEQRRKLRTGCTAIYQNTIDMKVKDLTVREEQQVRA